ncbi:MAG: hypothetical protein ACK46G_02310 [Flavobacteriales bacterium]|jgi:hypothetical protein
MEVAGAKAAHWRCSARRGSASGRPIRRSLQKGYDRLGDLAQRIAVVMSEWEAASAQMEELGEAN